MHLIIGLGNPGAEYENTRHNAGFRVIDALAEDMRANYWKSECDALVARTKMSGCVGALGVPSGGAKGNVGAGGGKGGKASGVSAEEIEIILAKPQTFMNLSGVAVRALCKKYKVTPDHLIVVHDELDIPPATTRVKFGGGHAGHNGLKSIIEKLGTRDWYRVRAGVGRPPGRMDVARFVLSTPKGEDAENFEHSIALATEATAYLLQNGLVATQQKYN